MKTQIKKPFQLALSCLLVGVACQPVTEVAHQSQPVVVLPINKVLPSRVKISQPTAKPLEIYGQAKVLKKNNSQTQVQLKLNFRSQIRDFKTQSLDCDNIVKIKATIQGLGISPEIHPDGGNPISITPGGCTFSGVVNFSNVPVGNVRVVVIEGLNAFDEKVAGSEVRVVLDITATGASGVEISPKTSLSGKLIELLADKGPQGELIASRLTSVTLQTLVDNVTGVSGSFGAYSFAHHPRLIKVQVLADDIFANGGSLGAIVPTDSKYHETPGTLTVNLQNIGSGDDIEVYLSDPTSTFFSTSTPNTPNETVVLSNTTPGNWTLFVKRYPVSSGIVDVRKIDAQVHNGAVTVDLDQAGPSDPNWQMLSGPTGGIVRAIMHAPSDPTRVYAALEGGGVYFSTNGGASWTLAVDNLTDHNVTAIAVHPSNADLVFIGTESSGVFTADFGSIPTWSTFNTGALPSTVIRDLVIDAAGNNLYAATESGVGQTGLGEDSWSDISVGLPVGSFDKDVHDLAFDYTNNKLAAAIPFGPQPGVYMNLSPDSAGSFVAINDLGITGTSPEDLTDLSVTAINFRGAQLQAGTQSGNLFVNNGTAWNSLEANHPSNAIHAIGAASDSPGFLFTGTFGGAVQFTSPTPANGSSTWSEYLNGTPVNNPFITSMAAMNGNSPVSLGDMLVGTKGGGVLKPNAPGNSWSVVNAGMNGQHIKDLIKVGSNIFAATYGGGVFRSNNNGSSWTALNNVFDNGLERFVLALAYDSVGDKLYAATKGAGVHVLSAPLSANSGTAWTAFKTNLPANAKVSSLAINSGGNKVYAGIYTDGNPSAAEGIYSSCLLGQSGCAAGANWNQFAPPASNRNIHALALKPGDPNTIYAGSDNEEVVVSSNAGTTWAVPFIVSSTGGKIVSIGTTDSDPDSVFIGKEGGSGDFFFASFDAGVNWVIATGSGNLLPSEDVLSIFVDPQNPDLIYAGTSDGVYRTRNTGDDWNAFSNSGFPDLLNNIPVSALMFNSDDGHLYGGTAGHSTFKTDLTTLPSGGGG